METTLASNSQRPACFHPLSAGIKYMVCVTMPGSEYVFLKQALQVNNHYQGMQMPTELNCSKQDVRPS